MVDSGRSVALNIYSLFLCHISENISCRLFQSLGFRFVPTWGGFWIYAYWLLVSRFFKKYSRLKNGNAIVKHELEFILSVLLGLFTTASLLVHGKLYYYLLVQCYGLVCMYCLAQRRGCLVQGLWYSLSEECGIISSKQSTGFVHDMLSSYNC